MLDALRIIGVLLSATLAYAKLQGADFSWLVVVMPAMVLTIGITVIIVLDVDDGGFSDPQWPDDDDA